MKQDWLYGLNPEQQTAVQHDHGPLLILAGAGSGKTTVLVARTGRLIDDGLVKAKQMCVMTFTNKAARELKHRVGHRLGDRAKGLWTGTFHSFGLQILRSHAHKCGLPKHFGILDQSDAQSLLKELLKDFKNVQKSAYDSETLLSMMSSWRESGKTEVSSETRMDDEYDVAVEWLLPKYLKRLEALGVVDFDGLLLKPLELMRNHPDICEKIQNTYQQVMVDEFQDTNKTQMQLLDIVVKPHQNLSVVGDDDQSIYGWRGAFIQNILEFPTRFKKCHVVRLERNYRSSSHILNLANAVIQKNEKRHGKKLIPASATQSKEIPEVFVYENEDEEVEGVLRDIEEFKKKNVAYRDMAVLYRSNSQGALLEIELRKQKIPYHLNGGTGFLDRKEVKDILAYLRCCTFPNEVAYRRILNTPSRGVGDVAIEALSLYSFEQEKPFHIAAREWQVAGVHDRAGEGLSQLHQQLIELRSLILKPEESFRNMALHLRLIHFLEQIGYKRYLETTSKDSLVFSKRWSLVHTFAQVFERSMLQNGGNAEALSDFLLFMELRDDPDDEKDQEDRVQLLTLHASKGLEFPVVFLIGVEEDLLPHKTLGSDIAEERRLFYVGVTRAKERLILSRARTRKRYGRLAPSAPSRFLVEIPSDLYRSYELGFRPVSEEGRKNLLADFYKKLDAQKIEI